jgi:serine/threonine-protein kinase
MLHHATAPWQPGQVIGGRYPLLGKLAVGGMAEVWLARQSGPQGFSRLVVIKRVLDSRDDPAMTAMFVEEAQLGARLTHPNIVQTVDFGEDAGVPFIVLEYLFGENFSRVLKESRYQGNPWPLRAAARVVSDAAMGLSAAHELKDLAGQPLNIVHRDVSPQNLFVTHDGLVKVLDFGIARAVDRAEHTEEHQLRGRVAYMSPEQIEGDPLDARTDVFALGLILWQAVTGTSPDASTETLVIMRERVSSTPIPSARSRNPEVPELLDAILSMALQKKREARFQSAAELHTALEDFLRQGPVCGATQLAALMAERFAEKHAERAQVISRLSTEAATPRFTTSTIQALAPRSETTTGLRQVVPPVAAAAASSDASAGEKSVEIEISELAATPRSRALPIIVVLLLVLGVSTGAVLAWKARGGDEARVEPVPTVTALPLPTPTPAPVDPPRPEPVVAPTPTPTPEPVAVTPSVKPLPAVPGKRAPAATGLLRLDTVPWTAVYLNGKKLGDTPLVDVKVPAGSLELTLVNEDEKIRTVIDLDVVAGQTTTKRLQF